MLMVRQEITARNKKSPPLRLTAPLCRTCNTGTASAARQKRKRCPCPGLQCRTSPQRDPPQYGGRDRSGRGEWRPVGREEAPVTPGPNTPDGGHATDSKEPLRHTLKLPPQTSGTSDLPGPSSAERTREPSTHPPPESLRRPHEQANTQGVTCAGPAQVTTPYASAAKQYGPPVRTVLPVAIAGPVASPARPARPSRRCCTGGVEGSRRTSLPASPVDGARPRCWNTGAAVLGRRTC